MQLKKQKIDELTVFEKRKKIKQENCPVLIIDSVNGNYTIRIGFNNDAIDDGVCNTYSTHRTENIIEKLKDKQSNACILQEELLNFLKYLNCDVNCFENRNKLLKLKAFDKAKTTHNLNKGNMGKKCSINDLSYRNTTAVSGSSFDVYWEVAK